MESLSKTINDGQSGFVTVTLDDWKRALEQAQPATDADNKLVADLRSGAIRAGDVGQVGVRRDQAKIVLQLQQPGVPWAPAPAPSATTEE